MSWKCALKVDRGSKGQPELFWSDMTSASILKVDIVASNNY